MGRGGGGRRGKGPEKRRKWGMDEGKKKRGVCGNGRLSFIILYSEQGLSRASTVGYRPSS